jgi:glycolate oxidase FAD binding subunit
MTDTIKPRDGKDVEEAVRFAVSNGTALELVGAGSKRGIGRPAQTDMTLDMSGLCGVTMYEPEELVLTAQAGTPLAEIEKLVGQSRQELAFEPIDYAPLFGGSAGSGTIGGTLAANLSGPRRIKQGAARDHFLGATVVTGRGETVKTGGRVVKNVTGYDLCKVLAGSWGTLAAMTEVTIKVLPRAETETTLAVAGLDDKTAARAMAAAMGSPFDVSGAAHLPDHIAAYFDGLPGEGAATCLRLEGFAPSVAHRKAALAALLKPFGAVAEIGEKNSRALWKSIRDAKPFALGEALKRPLWRISTEPMRGYELAGMISPAAQMFYDWAGGLIWVAIPGDEEPQAASMRDAVAKIGGHATLVRAPAAVRAAVDVFPPQDAGVAAVSKRVKESFDPSCVLNPGRMWAGV